MSNTKPLFGYWSCRGRGQAIRNLLAYLNVDYDEKLYDTGEGGPNHTQEEWLKDKSNLDLQFPNLPYWIDNENNIKLTEHRAILKHVARQYGPDLLPHSPAEWRDADLIDNWALEAHSQLGTLAYGYSERAEQTLDESAKSNFTAISKFLEGKSWVTGSKLSYVDFLLYEMFYHYKKYKASLVESFPRIVAFMTEFESLPAIVKFMSSPNYIASPCFTTFADLCF